MNETAGAWSRLTRIFLYVTCAAVLTWGGGLTLETPNILIVGCEGGEDRLEIRSVELLSYAFNSNPIQMIATHSGQTCVAIVSMIATHSVVQTVQGGHRLPFK